MEREIENLQALLEEKTAKITFLAKENRIHQEKMYWINPTQITKVFLELIIINWKNTLTN